MKTLSVVAGSGVTIRPNPSFLLKQLSPLLANQSVELTDFDLLDLAGEPVDPLKVYLVWALNAHDGSDFTVIQLHKKKVGFSLTWGCEYHEML